jgi:non-ribosomal peptide synthetase component F
LIRQAFEAEKQMLPHRRYPLSEIQKKQGGDPLFEAIFNYTHFHIYEQVRSDQDGAPIHRGGGFEQTNYPLTVQAGISVEGNQMFVVLEMDRAEFGREQREQMVRVYEQVLERMVGGVEEGHQVSFMGEVERERLLAEWNGRELEEGRETLVERFERVAEQRGEGIAVVSGEERMSYEELNRRANGLGRKLRGLGVGRETRVGLCVERTAELIVGMMGIVKAGGTYVPLEVEHPEERLEQVMGDAGVELVVAGEGQRGGLWERVKVVRVGEGGGEAGEGNVERVNEERDLAYIMYTSGSTGKAKGVMVSHGNVTGLLKGTEKRFGFGSADVWTMFHS